MGMPNFKNSKVESKNERKNELNKCEFDRNERKNDSNEKRKKNSEGKQKRKPKNSKKKKGESHSTSTILPSKNSEKKLPPCTNGWLNWKKRNTTLSLLSIDKSMMLL